MKNWMVPAVLALIFSSCMVIKNLEYENVTITQDLIDSYEPNDNTPRQIDIGKPVISYLGNNDHDQFSFIAEDAGFYSIEMFPYTNEKGQCLAQNLDPCLMIYDASGCLRSDSKDISNTFPLLLVNLTNGELCCFEIDNLYWGTKGAYRFIVQRETNTNRYYQDEPNDSPGTAIPLSNQIFQSTIYNGDMDYFILTNLQNGMKYHLNISPGLYSELSSCLFIVNYFSNGQTNQLINYDNDQKNQVIDMEFTYLSGIQYFLLFNDGRGNYQINISKSGDVVNDSYEFDDVPWLKTGLAANQTQNHNISYIHDRDWFRTSFSSNIIYMIDIVITNATNWDYIVITSNSVSWWGWASGLVYYPENTIDPQSSGKSDNCLNFVSNNLYHQTALFYFQNNTNIDSFFYFVSLNSNAYPINYAINMKEIGLFQFDPYEPLEMSNMAFITNGETQYRSYCFYYDTSDSLTVYANAHESFLLQMSFTNSLAIDCVVKDPDGQTVEDTRFNNLNDFALPFTAFSSGDYVITVTFDGFNQTNYYGAYTARLVKQ